MTTTEAIAFLEAHQPMPPDSALTEELIATYDEARRAVEGQRDGRVVSLILNSPGEGDGFGVYQLLDDTLRTFPREDVIDALLLSLRSPHRSVRAWSMELALDYLDARLIPSALERLAATDRDERAFAAYFLAEVDPLDASTLEAMRRALAIEEDEEIASVLRESVTEVRR